MQVTKAGLSSEPQMRERRRGERVLLRVPVKIFGTTRDNKQVAGEAETVVVSRSGALLRSRVAFKNGADVEITHCFTEQTETFRVVWGSEQAKEGRFDIGIELLVPRPDFWGVAFPDPPRRS
jgi:hypothetical protein